MSGDLYVIARNAGKRPTLQHRMDHRRSSRTTCGVQMLGWSRSYSDQPIPVLYCRRCAKLTAATASVPVVQLRLRAV